MGASAVWIMLAEFFAVLGLLLWADRWLHRNLQGVMLLLANDEEVALWLYAILLLPGVALHELSHALTAAILGVKIGRINILPRRAGKRIQLGFVPVQETDVLRASLIGVAPMLIGGGVIVALGYNIFGTPDVLAALSSGDVWAALRGLSVALKAPDVWLWAYLVFAIGNTMLPSRADTHAWPALAVVLGLLTLAVLLVGGGATLLNGFGHFLTMVVRWIVLLGGSTLLVDLPFFALIFVILKLLERAKGVRLVYR
ncbi:MAG TPA: hypothetical protein PKH77_22240 [Anaerolineae bacterium]|nr:hypothetical protein [Anaerolineae bacterium]